MGEVPLLCERLLEDGLVGTAGEGGGMVFLLADRERGLLLECTPCEMHATWIEDGWLVATNHFLTPAARKWAGAGPGTLAAGALTQAGALGVTSA